MLVIWTHCNIIIRVGVETLDIRFLLCIASTHRYFLFLQPKRSALPGPGQGCSRRLPGLGLYCTWHQWHQVEAAHHWGLEGTPLAPVGMKDRAAVEGMAAVEGNPLVEGTVAVEDSPLVEGNPLAGRTVAVGDGPLHALVGGKFVEKGSPVWAGSPVCWERSPAQEGILGMFGHPACPEWKASPLWRHMTEGHHISTAGSPLVVVEVLRLQPLKHIVKTVYHYLKFQLDCYLAPPPPGICPHAYIDIVSILINVGSITEISPIKSCDVIRGLHCIKQFCPSTKLNNCCLSQHTFQSPRTERQYFLYKNLKHESKQEHTK